MNNGSGTSYTGSIDLSDTCLNMSSAYLMKLPKQRENHKVYGLHNRLVQKLQTRSVHVAVM